MTDPGTRDLLPNLTTLKVESSQVNMQFLRYVRARSPLRNLSVRRSSLGHHILFYDSLPPPPPQRNTVKLLKVLDISQTGEYSLKVLNEWVFNDDQCQVTHLFMEHCPVLPRAVPAHVKIEFLSVTGYNAGSSECTFLDIEAWAAIPSIREINASGSTLNQVQRDELVTKHPNVEFDLSEDFRESPRNFF
jgi:hypothetical protein